MRQPDALVSLNGGQFINMKIKINTNNALFMSVIAIFSCVIILFFSSKLLTLTYMTNDDAGIQASLSGFLTGEPYPYHQFINCKLGVVVCSLYKLFPNIQWWHVISVGMMLGGIYLIHYNLLELLVYYRYSLIVRIILIALLSCFIWPYFIARSSFTVVPCIFALGFLTFLYSPQHNCWGRVLVSMGAVLVADLFRQNTGQVMLCFFFLGTCVYLSKKDNFCKKKVETSIMLGVLLLSLLYVNHEYNIEQYYSINSDEFIEYNEQRISFTDYSHVSYYQNSEFYEEMGWSEELYALATQWCFLDERVNANTWRKIADNSLDEKKDIKSVIVVWYKLLKGNMVACYLSFLGFIQLIICCFQYKNYGKQYKLFFFGNVIGSISMILYLCYLGRMPLRAYAIVLLPFIINNLFIVIPNWAYLKKQKFYYYMIFPISFVLVYVSLFFLDDQYINNMEKKQIYERKKVSSEISSFLLKNQDNVYIGSVLNYWANDVDCIYSDEKPNNYVFWGGSTWLSDLHNKRLKLLGINEKVDMEIFKRNNVYLLTSYIDSKQTDEVFSTTLSNFFRVATDYQAIAIEKIDDIEKSASIWRIIFDEDLDGYSGLYVQSGHEFIYENGRRVYQNKRIDLEGNDVIFSNEKRMVRIFDDVFIDTLGEVVVD